MKGGYKIIDFKHIPLSDAEHPVLVPNLRTVLDENYGKAVLLTNVVLGEDSMDDCFSTVVLKSNGRIKLNSYDGYITVDSDSYAHYTEGSSGDPAAEIEEIKEDIQDIQSDIGDLNGKVDDVSGDLGNLSDLDTTDKSSAVAAINKVNTKVSKTEDLISIVENGNTCTHTGGISKGQYVNWKGDLYTADSNISVGATFASSGGSKNLTAVADGGLNALNDILTANNFGTVVTLSANTDYTATSDGYFQITLEGTATSKYVIGRINASAMLSLAIASTSLITTLRNTMLVKKGMILKFETNAGDNAGGRFIPII